MKESVIESMEKMRKKTMDIQHRNRADRCKGLLKYMEIMKECEGMNSEEISIVTKELEESEAYERVVSDYFEGRKKENVKISAGMEIVQVGEIGLLGSYLLGIFHREKLLTALPKHFIKSQTAYFSDRPACPDTELLERLCVSGVYPLSERGIYASLFALGKDTGLGMRVDYHQILMKQATVEFCEIFDQDPMSLLSCGSFLLICDHGYEAVRTFTKEGIPAAVIGHMTKDKDKLICHEEYDSNLNRPAPDAYLQILKAELKGEADCL